MVLELKYGDLTNTVSETDRLANEIGQYCDELSNKVQQKMYAVEGGMSSALNSADYYVKQKISQLRARESGARNLSAMGQALLDTAKRVDSDVESTIEANQRSFFQRNPDLKPSGFQLFLTAYLCDLKNVPILGWLIKGGEIVLDAIDALVKDIRYWYKCEGGKELIGIILSIAGTILAIVLLVCACIFTAGTILAVIVAVAGIIGAVIGTINAVTNIFTSVQAYNAAVGGHPGQAQIYAGQDKLSDVLRETNYHDRDKNRASNAWATTLDVVETVCAVIAIVDGVSKTIKAFKNFNYHKVIQSFCQPHNKTGYALGKPTLWNGIKSFVMKFNIKEFILGDLNVKNLSRLSKLDVFEQAKAIGSLAKAAKGIVDGLDKVNEGKQSFGQFLANRVIIGLDQTFLREQEVKTRVDTDGNKLRKYWDTKLTTIFKTIRSPIDELGLGRLLTDAIGGSGLSDTLNMKKGILQDIVKIIDSLKPSPGSRGYFGDIKAPALNFAPGGIPNIDIAINIDLPTFALPSLDFNLDFKCSHPYLDVAAA